MASKPSRDANGIPLALLPAELLAYLCEFVLSSKILLLCLSGDRRLMQNLSYLVKLELIDTTGGSTSRWPQILPQFRRLKSLSIHRPNFLLGRKTFLPQLNSMDSLTSLSLNLQQQDLQLWYHSLKKTPLWTLFPNLQSLKILGPSPFEHRWMDESQFPTTLTHLDLGLPLTEVSFLLLPKSLRSLRAKYLAHFAECPPLTELSCTLAGDNGARDFKMLPSSLLKLQVHLVVTPLLSVISDFPRLLTNLLLEHDFNSPECVANIGSMQFYYLQSLMTLSLRHRSSSSILNICGSFAPELCPPQLEVLEMGVYTMQAELTLPPKLKRLILPNGYSRLVVSYYSIESTLESLKSCQGFPSSLTHFSCPSITVQPTDGNLAPFTSILLTHPPYNKHISILKDTMPESKDIISLTKAGVRSVYLTFPPNTRGPKMNSLFLCEAWSTIESIRLKHITIFHEITFRGLPKTLTNLAIRFGKTKPSTTLGEIIFKYLPKSLTTLSLDEYTGNTLTGDGLRYIGRLTQLVSLEASFDRIDVPELKNWSYLPRSLRELCLHCADAVNGKCLAYFPRYLKKLIFSGLKIVDEADFMLLPRSLLRLEIDIPAPSPTAASMLPTGLEHLTAMTQSRKRIIDFVSAAEDEASFIIDSRVPNNSFLSHNNPKPSST
jgi:hypothetical protein